MFEVVSEKETFEGPAMRVLVAMMEGGRLETGVAKGLLARELLVFGRAGVNGLLARELLVFGRVGSDGVLSVEILLLVSDMAKKNLGDDNSKCECTTLEGRQL